MAQSQLRDSIYFEPHLRTFNPRNLMKIDWLLPVVVIGLAFIGWLTLYSANHSTSIFNYQRQIGYFLVGTGLAAGIICIDYRLLVWLGPVIYALTLLMLAAVLSFGKEVRGGQSWMDLGVISFQPSEVAKVALVYSLTWYLSTLGERIRGLHWFILTFILILIPMAMILKQPDLGTAACLAPLVVIMLFIAGCRWWHLLIVILLGLSALPLLWWQMKDFDPDVRPEGPTAVYELKYHQKMRIYTFLNPEYDPQGSGWHTRQSMITVGSGGFSGKGYMNSTQTKLNYLPEHHNDFIFSLYAEEQGFVGGIALLSVFALLLLRGISIARQSVDMQGTLLAVGVVSVLAFHIFVNIAITIGLMPVTGIPLPFLSFGGSFYLTTMMCVGILLNVPMRRRALAV
jgi:rod shape determining protein RodA